jgi:S1-C subfamily serine protease
MIYYLKIFLFFVGITFFVSCSNEVGLFGEVDGNDNDSIEIKVIEEYVDSISPISLPKKLLDASVTVMVYDKERNFIQFGSGVFVKSNIIATNFHVIEGGWFFRIKRDSEKKLIDAEIYKFDDLHDVALLKIDTEFPNSVLSLNRKFPELGTDIMVAGSPEGLTGTLSKGIVSAIRKYPPYDYDLIQISAPISHGSSGGPVVNMDGEIIGISVSITEGEGVQNLNFAVPAKYVQFLLAE